MRKGMAFFILFSVLLLMPGFYAGAEAETEAVYSSAADLSGKKIGVVLGKIYESVTRESIPDAEVEFFNSGVDMMEALRTGRVDACVDDEQILKASVSSDPSLACFSLGGMKYDTGFAFDKDRGDPVLIKALNEHIRKLRDEGTLAKWEKIWMGADESLKQQLNYEELPATVGTLHIAVDTLTDPFVSMKNNEIIGYEIAILTDFCREKGYAMELTVMDFDALIPALAVGKGDLAAAGFSIMPERMEAVQFSEPTYSSGAGAVVRTGLEREKESFFARLGNSFEKTFIREKRYLMFLEGICNTVLISVLSVVFGTILGFLVYLWCRRGSPVVGGITRFAVWLVQGMPLVVLMMALYYIVFARIAIDGIAVAVIGFTIMFSTSVYGMLQSSVSAVPNGQTEASSALGFNDRQTFFGIILPQALPYALSSYKGGVSSLIRGTSIVGYIAVQDLTKMGDIIRSRTYEAFFPIVVVAVIYFVLAGLVNLLVGRLLRLVNPKRGGRKGLLKGVNMHD